MKIKICCMAMMLLAVVILFQSVCHSELTIKKERSDKWILFGKSSVGIHYYDKRSIEKVNATIIKVWTKIKLSNEEKNKLIQERIKNNLPTDGWEELSEEVALNELDCANKTFKVNKLSDYNCHGKIINDLALKNKDMEKVTPETINEGLVRIACMNK
jgi:hypothetical protein